MIKAIITDFDGTLVDTFEANLAAYRKVLGDFGVDLSREKYRKCFGLRFDAFMAALGINDEQTREKIKDAKTALYPSFFEKLIPNKALINFLESLKNSGVKIAIASTARKENLMNVLSYLGLADSFDLILAGVNVSKGKPDPEIYNLTMERLGVSPEDVLIFEDSDVGLQAAEASGAKYIRVTEDFFKYEIRG